MPSVLFISPFVWEGGLHTGKPTVYYIMRGFLGAGYDVHVICATNKPGLTDTEFDGLHVHYFRIPFGFVGFEYDALTSYLTLIRSEPNRILRHVLFRIYWLQFVLLGMVKTSAMTRRLHPTLLYGINNPTIPIASLLGAIFRIPNFSRIMGSPLGQWAQLNVNKSENSRGGVRYRSRHIARLWAIRFDEMLAFRLPCDALIVTDDGTISTETITGWLGVHPEKLQLLRNGIDKRPFQNGPDRETARQMLGIPTDARVVLWVSQLVDWKHPERLINAVPEVLTHCPSARFLVVGDGPEKEGLLQRVRELRIEDAVTVVGSVRRDVIPLYYRAADIFTAFYDYANISNTLLEAMLSGNAVLALDNGHTADVVRHMDNGVLVDPDHPAQITDALVKILSDDSLRERLGRAAATYADEQLLTWEQRIDLEIMRIEAIVGACDKAG